MCIRMWWMRDNAFTCPWLEESIWNLLFWDEIFNIMTNDALSTLLGFEWHVNRNRLVSSHSICTLFITNNGIINPVYDNFLHFTEILSVLLKLIMQLTDCNEFWTASYEANPFWVCKYMRFYLYRLRWRVKQWNCVAQQVDSIL